MHAVKVLPLLLTLVSSWYCKPGYPSETGHYSHKPERRDVRLARIDEPVRKGLFILDDEVSI